MSRNRVLGGLALVVIGPITVGGVLMARHHWCRKAPVRASLYLTAVAAFWICGGAAILFKLV